MPWSLKRSPIEASFRMLFMALALAGSARSIAAAESPEAPSPTGRSARLADRPRDRAHFNALLRSDANGHLLSENRQKALRQACELPVDASMRRTSAPSRGTLGTFPGLSWQSIGPRSAESLRDYGFAFGAVAGRINCVTVHPANSASILLGSSTGGIWKSTDSGVTFRSVSDSAPALAISAIVHVPSNPSIVYAATGDVDAGFDEFTPSGSLGIYLGAGILRSVNAGESWIRIDTNLPANSIVSRVLVHPSNPQLVLAGLYITQDLGNNTKAPGGVYRSTDGGVTFAKKLSAPISDLTLLPSGSDGVVFAASGLVSGCNTCTDPSGVYRSTDFGSTFTPSLVPSTPGIITFKSPTGNIKLTAATGKAGSPSSLYASVVDSSDSHTGGGIFRSTDLGATWVKRAIHPNMCGDQCFYDHFIAASSTEPGLLYFGSIDLYRSTDGAGTWTQLTDVYNGGSTVHPDYHAATFVAGKPGTVYVANDGGLYRSIDGGSSFQNLNSTLTLSQFNGIALHPVDPAFAMGGTQDNGNLRFKNTLVWTDRTAGDGGFNLIQQNDPSRVLAANYFAFLNLSTDGGETFKDVCPTPLMNCNSGQPTDPMLFYPPAAAAPGSPGVVFIGTNRVWAHPSFGADPVLWAPRSTTPIASGIRVSALEVVGDGNGVIWTGTQGGGVRLSSDGGKTFGPPGTGMPRAVITKIRSVSADGRSAYVSLGGYSGMPSQHLFRTADGGQSWVNVSGNLPDVPVTALAVDPGDPADLFIGTDVGAFRSTNGGASWTSFNEGLPNVSVSELSFHPITRDLFASTYGRGIFRIVTTGTGTLIPTADFVFSPEIPAPGESVSFEDRSAGSPTSSSWDFGDGTPLSTLKNPRHVFTQPFPATVRLTATNSAGSGSKSRVVNIVSGDVSPVTLQVPVVLDVFGLAPTHFTSDLVLVNRSPLTTRVSVLYLPAPNTPGVLGPRIGINLEKGHEFRTADVIGFLRSNGYDLPTDGTSIVGTLRLTFEDVSDPNLVFAGSRTSTPNPNAAVGGSFGLFASGVSASAAPSTSASIYGLREDSAFRTNLALVDVPGGSGPSTLSIQLFDGDTGFAAGAPFSYALKAGEWHQIGSILSGSGATNGYAKVTKTGGGSNRFLVYGVVNDGASTGGGTSDGSFLGSDASSGLVPIVLHVTSGTTVYTSELYLANPGSSASTVTLTYTPSRLLGGSGTPATATLALPAGRQLRIPDAIFYLRDTLGLPLLSGSSNQGGTLNVVGATASVRTSNANPDSAVGGTFGLAYPAIPPALRAKTSAWVYGLLQNRETRSNLAIADARVGDATSVTYLVDVYDALSGDGTQPVTSLSIPLSGGQWYQFSKILETAGLSNGFVRIRPQTGSSDYVVYGILNDGQNPGERTSDGSYVPMSGAE